MRRHKDFVAVLLVNVFFLLLCVVLGKLRYGALDDFFMAGVLSGIHGDAYNPHLYFVNALYGYALLPFYLLFPKVGWYYIFEMLGIFTSFVSVSFVIVKKLGFSSGLLLSTILLSLLSSDLYLGIQFTLCAVFFSVAGMLAILYGLNAKKCIAVVAGCLLLFWGSLMRWSAFLMGLPIFFVLLLFNLNELKFRKKIVSIVFVVISLLVVGAHHFDRVLYDTDEYRPYKEIQGPRAAFGDASHYNMQAVYEDLEEVGKSGMDYGMLTSWMFYDTENFRVDSLRKILKYVDYYKNEFRAAGVLWNLKGPLESLSGFPIFWVYIILCVALFMGNYRKYPFVFFSLGYALCLMAYLLYLGRLWYRVELGIWLYASLLTVPLLKKRYEFSKKFSLIIVAELLLVNIGVFWQLGDWAREPDRGLLYRVDEDKKDYTPVFKYIEDNPDKIFLVGMPTYMAFAGHRNPPYLSEPTGGFKRVVSFGYWTPYLPEITQSLKDFGITNPLKDVVKDNVVVVDVPNISDYLQMHYYDSVSVRVINKINDVTFYKYSVEDKR